jgi:nucleotidyltransferase/DNA polymerase involved in DNA repair
MQACLENPTLPLRESIPTWTIRITRPAGVNRNELTKELSGVPKAALRQVFGKIMGTRLWQLNRAIATTAPTSAKNAPVAAIPTCPSSAPVAVTPQIPDREISSGMLQYLCFEAAATLRDRKRLAKSISLTVLYSDGASESVRQPLPRVTNEATALETAARLALRSMRSNAFVSLKLDLTATPAQP